MNDGSEVIIIGAIRCPGYYADGEESFEIWLSDSGQFPLVSNQRSEYILRTPQGQFICGIRFTERNGGWVCPDLHEVSLQKRKVRLSNILKKNGFQRNEKVKLFLDSETRIFEIEKY